MTTRRAVVLGLLATAFVALVVNAIVVSRETRGAEADLGRIVALPGPDLQVREDGRSDRPPIVLLHGVAGSIRWWDRLVPELASRYRVIGIDLVGHGGSEKPRDGYDPPAQAAQVERVLDVLEVERPLVVGHSVGGVVATALAERDPRLARGLVMLGAPPDREAFSTGFLLRVSTWPLVGQLGRRVGTDATIRRGLEDAFAGGERVPPEFVDDFRDTTYTSYTSTRSEARDWLGERPAPRRLRDLGVPVLAVDGEEDQLVKPEALSDWRALPGARTRLLPDVGHSPQWEAAHQTAELIIGFDRRG